MGKTYLPEGISKEKRTKFLNLRIREQKPGICTERARLITESDKETQGYPVIIKRALALKYILNNMSVYIMDEELIVGHHASRLRYAPIFPEISSFSKKELDLFPTRNVDTLQITEEEKRYLLEEIYPYWEGKKQEDIADYYFPESLRQELAQKNKIFDPVSRTRSGYGHYVADFKTVLKIGFSGIEKMARQKLANLDDFDPYYGEKMHYYQANIIICEAVKVFAQRYSKLAKKLADEELDLRRKKELELIGSVCDRVPYKSARGFHEALQSYFFTLMIDYIFQNGSAISAGRFDQYIYPYYKKDIENNVITDDDALELLEALLVQHLDIIKAGTYGSVRNNGGFATTIHMTIGGCDNNGQNSTNKLSYLILDADKNVFNSEPNIGLRVNETTPDDLIEKLLENLVYNQGGKYPIFNDKAIIPALESDGVTNNDANNYCVVGCVEPTPSGNTLGLTNASFFNVAKCLELALNNGVDMLTGAKMGPQTGEIDKFKSYDDVWKAFLIQLEYFTRRATLAMNLIVDVISKESPHIYCSVITDGCMEKGKDSAAGGAKYNFVGIQGVGLIDTADSLYVIKKAVFEEKFISLRKLRETLLDNFENEEYLRQYLINRIPKYGNDIDDVDQIAVNVTKEYCAMITRGSDIRGAKYRAGMYCLSSNTPMGRQTAAMPNGRLSQTPLADGGVSPKHGMDISGPTAAAKSVAKLEHFLATNGTNYNQKYLVSLMSDLDNRKKLIDLIRTYFSLGAFQIQFNILNPESLKAAQKNPENYRSLVVRVAGYSAFFVELDTEIQNEIISRTEYSNL